MWVVEKDTDPVYSVIYFERRLIEMPFISLNTWPGLTAETKKEWTEQATAYVVNEFSFPPDKILILIREYPQGSWSHGGAVATDGDFAVKSRTIDWATGESYHEPNAEIANLAVIEIDLWNV